MGNRFTHVICQLCWNDHFAQQRGAPVKMVGASPEPCCFCGTVTSDGIYVREYPERVRCRGTGPNHGE
jgi:hypothetical protein